MNQFTATLTHIKSIENLNQLSFSFGKINIIMLGLALKRSLNIGDKVRLSIKATDIALAKEEQGQLSHCNQVPARILKVDNGQLLSSVTVDFNGTLFSVLISLKSSLQMKLQKEDEITLLFKGSGVSICDV